MPKLLNKIVVVTGASKGIGASIAAHAAAEGAKVVVNYASGQADAERVVAAGPEATTLLSRDKGNPLAVVYPTDGSLLMVSPSGIPKDAPSPNAGKLYMEFLLSKEAAEVQVKSHNLSVVKGVAAAPGAKPLESIKVIRPTEEEITKGIPEVKKQFRDTFGI